MPEAYAYHAKMLASKGDRYSPTVRARLEMGRDISAQDYVQAQGDRVALRDQVDRALGKCDVLILPSMPIPAPLHHADMIRVDKADEAVRPMMLRLTQTFNLTGHPAISLPCGVTSLGLPCGFQMVGPRTDTRALLAAALACEPHVTLDMPRCSGF